MFVTRRPQAFDEKLICKWSWSGTVDSVNSRRNSYTVRYHSLGGPNGEAAGELSKLLPAKRLKNAAVTASNAAFIKALRASNRRGGGVAPPQPPAEVNDGDDAEEEEEGMEQMEEELDADAAAEYASEDDLEAGEPRPAFAVAPEPGPDSEYLQLQLDDSDAVEKVTVDYFLVLNLTVCHSCMCPCVLVINRNYYYIFQIYIHITSFSWSHACVSDPLLFC